MKNGDILAIADGLKIVSIAKVVNSPTPSRDLELRRENGELKNFPCKGGAVACSVEIHDLQPEEVLSCNRGRTFYAMHGEFASEVKSLFEKYF